MDRLNRRPVELEGFVQTRAAAGVQHVTTVQGDLNLGTSDGLLIARIVAAVAADESARKANGCAPSCWKVARSGKPHGGTRPFGYEPDGVTLRGERRPPAGDRLLAGESLTSLSAGSTTRASNFRWRHVAHTDPAGHVALHADQRPA